MPELTRAGKTVEKLEEKVKELEVKILELYTSLSLFQKFMIEQDYDLEDIQKSINPSLEFMTKKLKKWNKKKQSLLSKIKKIEEKKGYKKYVSV